MNREYIEKKIFLKKLVNFNKPLALFFIIVILFAIYLMVSLISFNPVDPGWSQTTWGMSVDTLTIHNLGGKIGAWLADVLLLIFGKIAYLVPLVIIILYWIILDRSYRKINIDYFNFTLRIIGALVLLITSCGLAEINTNDIWYFTSGGVVGHLLSSLMARWFSNIVSTSILLFLWIAGTCLYINISWFVVTEKIGSVIIKGLNLSNYCSFYEKRFRANNTNKKNNVSPKDIISSLKITPPQDDTITLTSVKNKKISFKKGTQKKLSDNSNFKENDLVTADDFSKHPRKDFPPIIEQMDKTHGKKILNDQCDKTICQKTPNLINLNHYNNELNFSLVKGNNKYYNISTLLPKLSLLTAPPIKDSQIDLCLLKQMAYLVEDRLADYRIKAKVVDVLPGPVITCFELELAPGVKASRISNLSNDLARLLSVSAVRVVEIIPGKPYVGLELPNKDRNTVYVREILDCDEFYKNSSPLSIILGKDTVGKPVIIDLAKMPHLLIAGTTGSGKSIGINVLIISILYKTTPEDVRFIMIDPKILELSVYNDIPHLLTKVITNVKDAANALRWCVKEMERRYMCMSNLHVRSVEIYNKKIIQTKYKDNLNSDKFEKLDHSIDIDMHNMQMIGKLPYIVIIIDELSDLMMSAGKEIESLITRLAQKARAAGIHLILATQRPSVDVITGLIKANIPTRIAFTVSSKIDSRTILDQGGAESLLGMGDMLYLPINSSIPIRIHGAFVQDEEIQAIVNHWKKNGNLYYTSGITSNEENKLTKKLKNKKYLDPLLKK